MGVGGGHITADCKQRKEGRGAFYGESQALGEGGDLSRATATTGGAFHGRPQPKQGGGTSGGTATTGGGSISGGDCNRSSGGGHFTVDRDHRGGDLGQKRSQPP